MSAWPTRDAVSAWPISPLELGVGHVATDLYDGRPTTLVWFRYSRALWAEPMEAMTGQSVARVLAHAVRYFRGCPREWRFEWPYDGIADGDLLGWSFKPPLVELGRCCSSALTVSSQVPRVIAEASPVLREWLARCPERGLISKGPPTDLRVFFDRAAQRRHPLVPQRSVAQMQIIERAFLLPEPGLELEALFEDEDDAPLA
jgi:hypothetical protein